MFSSLVGQSRTRWALLPGATKGWNASSFPSTARAMEFAMASKRMKFSWLAQATRIPIDKLKAAVRTGLDLTSEEVKKIELYLGVPIRARFTKRVQKSPP